LVGSRVCVCVCVESENGIEKNMKGIIGIKLKSWWMEGKEYRTMMMRHEDSFS